MANSRAKEEFSERLRRALREGGVSAGSPTRLAQEFNDRYSGRPVSQQAVRKWLSGETIPSHDKILALAGWLRTRPDWLQYGTGGDGHAAQQPAAPYRKILSDQELVRRYRRLTHGQQQAVMEIITGLAAKDRRR